MIPLLALGPHIFEILPMNLQKLEEKTKANWPAVQRFGVGPARQFTGMGEGEIKIEGLIFNEEFGGYGDYLALKDSQKAGLPLDLIGWGAGAAFATIFGPVCILEISATHEHIGRDGLGRKLTFNVECAPFGEGGAGGLF